MNCFKYLCNFIIVFKWFNKFRRDFMYWLWVLIIGVIIGVIVGVIINKGKLMGWISNIIVGLVGFVIGEVFLGLWGL